MYPYIWTSLAGPFAVRLSAFWLLRGPDRERGSAPLPLLLAARRLRASFLPGSRLLTNLEHHQQARDEKDEAYRHTDALALENEGQNANRGGADE